MYKCSKPRYSVPIHNRIRSGDEWKKILQKEYVMNKKSCITIAKEYKCGRTTVLRWLHRLKFFVRGTADTQKGVKRSDEFCLAVSKATKGVNTWMKGRHLTDKTKKKLSIKLSGKNNPNWKGGKTPLGLRIRTSQKYLDWRLEVFKRDGFKCVGCGDSRGGNLQAHHILSFAKYPEQRLNVSNGTTLCNICHVKIHPEINLFKKII